MTSESIYFKVKDYKLKKEQYDNVVNNLKMYLMLNNYNINHISQSVSMKKIE